MILPKTLVYLAALVFLALPASAQSLFVTSCGEDGEINATTRKAIDSVATSFIQAVLGSNPASAFDTLSEEGRSGLTSGQLPALAGGIVRQYEPKDVTLQHTYLIHLKGDSPGRVVCASDLSKPSGWESLRAASVPEQAYAALSAEGVNNHLVFTVWLVPEKDAWKVQSFSLNVSSLADNGTMQLLDLARHEQARNHNFNAALLYAAAQATADRGPNFQMGITQSISEDMSKFVTPPDISGEPPFVWKNGGITYKVLNIGPIAVGGKIYVIINHEVSPWQTDEQVDNWNKDLIKFSKLDFQRI